MGGVWRDRRVTEKGVLRKFGRVMGMVQSKQVAIDWTRNWREYVNLLLKLMEAGKEVAQSAENMPKSQENKGIF